VGSAQRINSKLVVAAVIAGLTLIGWVSRNTRAQNSPVNPKLPQDERSADKPSNPSSAGPKTDPPNPHPSELDAISESSVPKLADPPPADRLPPPAHTAPRSPFALDPNNEMAIPANDDDPEKTVQAFISQNRNVAQSHLVRLKEEERLLRSRLERVEAGIKRWEALLSALEKSGVIAVAESPKPHRVPAARPEAESSSSPPNSETNIKRAPRFSVKRVPVGPSTERETPPPLDSVPSEKQSDSAPPAPAEDPAPPPAPR
jgi:hypothetical protein